MTYDEQPDAPLHGECAAEIERLTQENEPLRKDAAELCQALEDLSFESWSVWTTKAPTNETYNRTFAVLDTYRKKRDAAIKGETKLPTKRLST